MSERFEIDWIQCDGYGLCGDFAPGLIELDEWRYPILPEGPIPPAQLGDAQRAVDCCPMKALRLVRVVDADDRRSTGRAPDRPRAVKRPLLPSRR